MAYFFIERKTCVLIFLTIFFLPETQVSVRSTKQNIITKEQCLHVKYSLFLVGFSETRIFSSDFREMPKY